MKKIFIAASCLLLIACGNNSQPENNSSANTATDAKAPFNLVKRESVSSKPVESYEYKFTDGEAKLNNWVFRVNLNETINYHDYEMDIVYHTLEAKDTITIPNLSIEPKVGLKKLGNTDVIIGFYDKNNEFKDYFKVYVQDDNLRVEKIKSYNVKKVATETTE
ncbi:hypothetical protein [Polluticaenibacter yanchengensis]|uniref:Lipoprotein n=1 Tax=Polluticaenibacter yanchengensis TaxID=3014562 RepID=A0ABT4UIB9_9BACT|nr:hypothetical protein [Chitinophagaceae bacterium LY-5]